MIQMKMDVKDLTRGLSYLERQQIPFATSLALNETAKKAQGEQRKGMARHFTLRRKQWADRSVKIKPFANKRNLTVTLKIDPPGGQSDIFSKFEDGGVKRPRDGKRLAVPDEVRRTKTGVVSKGQRPRAFNFQLRGKGPKATVHTGDKRTIMIRTPDGRGGIYQRRGRGKGSRLVQLYNFIPRARIDKRLRFESTITGTARKVFAGEFRTALRRALATRRT